MIITWIFWPKVISLANVKTGFIITEVHLKQNWTRYIILLPCIRLWNCISNVFASAVGDVIARPSFVSCSEQNGHHRIEGV